MVTLALTFYLGSALSPVAAAIAREVGARVGMPVAFDPLATDVARHAALEEPPAGILWLCGLDTVLRRDAGRLDASIVAAPVFPGRTRPVYDSVIVASERWAGASLVALRGSTLAINEPESWSGHHALRAHLVSLGLRRPIFGRVLVSGSHEASIDALLEGAADCAAIDDTVWSARIARDPRTTGLRVIDRTEVWPAPPFSLVPGPDPRLDAAVREALLDAAVPGLEAVAPATDADYAVFRDGLAASRSLAWTSP
jgi:ABC-type phosphate/phosphonate transport system substrate-binding protein